MDLLKKARRAEGYIPLVPQICKPTNKELGGQDLNYKYFSPKMV
jgi:hypothetical protein